MFCCSLADVFERKPDQPVLDEWRAELFELVENTPALTWQLLTKRPKNVLKMVPKRWRSGFPSHVWVGATVENQKYADIRLPHLMKIPSRVRFLSCEPLIGEIVIKGAFPEWVIAGGESGGGARATNPDHIRSLLNQCKAKGVPFFFKQWGVHDHEGKRVGKKNAGAILDGVRWLGIPA